MIVLWMIHCVFFAYIFLKLCDYDFKPILSYWNRLFPSTKSAQRLFRQLISVNGHNLIGKNIELCEYKYFTSLVYEQLKSSISYGTPIFAIIGELKGAISKDLVFEKKINSSIGGGLYQMLVIAAIGYMFTLMASFQLKLSITLSEILFVLITQVLGASLFTVLALKLKAYHFKGLEEYIKALYQIRSLNSSQVPISKIYKLTKIDSLSESKALLPFKERTIHILERIKNYGEFNSSDFDITINELWQSMEFKFDEYLKHLAALKLLIIVFVFLGSFLYMLLVISTKISL